MNKYLTLEDLVKFCAEQKLKKFSSNEFGSPLRVSVPAQFEISEENNSSTLFAYIKVMHTGRNRNGSNLTENAAKECMDTLAYKPILANFCEIDGVKDFTSHDMIINNDGETEYLEKQVGCFTADKPYLQEDGEHEGRKYIYAKIAIPREYTDTAEIIERKNGTKCSAELDIFEMSYDSKEKELLLESAELLGCTLLGLNPETGEEIGEGMEDAHVQLEDFSAKNNSVHFELNDEIKEFIRETVKESFEDIVTNNTVETKKGGVDMADFDENVEVTETEEVEETSTEESAEEVTVTEEEKAEEVTPDEEETVEDEKSEEFEEKSEEESKQNFVKMSVDINGSVKNFSVSLADKLNALYTLVNDTYAESDNDWYEVDGFDDEKYVLMHGWFSGKHYKQSYSVKKDVYSLKGDRVEVFATYLTADEQKQLEDMKSNYSSISEKLQKYEEEPDKLAILQSDEYSDIADSEEFKEFCKRESYFEMSVDEVKAKADQMLLEAAKAHKVDFSTKEEKKSVGMKKLPISNKSGKSGRYGGLFSKK